MEDYYDCSPYDEIGDSNEWNGKDIQLLSLKHLKNIKNYIEKTLKGGRNKKGEILATITKTTLKNKLNKITFEINKREILIKDILDNV